MLKILLIEDDEIDAENIQRILKRCVFDSAGLAKNAEITHVTYLEKGLDVLNENKNIDIILLDLHLPDGSGVELVQTLSEKYSHVPIVVLTGQDPGDKLGAELVCKGAQDYMSKNDVSQNSLSRSIQYAIHRTDLSNKIIEQTEELKRVNEAHAAFSYTVSHDLKAPLRTIVGFSEIVLKNNQQNLDKKSIAHLNHVVSGAKKMDQLMDSILEHSKIGNGDMEKEEVNVKEIVDSVVTLIDADIKTKHALITVDATFPVVACHKEQISQVFLNLIGNSLKYTPAGKIPEIHIGYIQKDNAPTFYVKDNGIGIEENQFSRIFGIFSRLHAGEGEYKGLGIGLTNVKKIVEIHGGEIYPESILGEGATFYFNLQDNGQSSRKNLGSATEQNQIKSQLHIAPEKPAEAPLKEYEPAIGRETGSPALFHLLLVDDDEIEHELIKEVAERHNVKYSISCVSSGQQAIDYVHGNNKYNDRIQYPMCDMMLLDINMPGLNGFDVLHEIKTDNRKKQLPVVMYSSSEAPVDKKKAADLGAVAYLKKGLNVKDLSEKIDGFMFDMTSLKKMVVLDA